MGKRGLGKKAGIVRKPKAEPKSPKCDHDIREFTFQDGGTIRCCMKMIPHVDKAGKVLWYDRCSLGTQGVSHS